MTDSATYEEHALVKLLKIPDKEATETKAIVYALLSITAAIREVRK